MALLLWIQESCGGSGTRFESGSYGAGKVSATNSYHSAIGPIFGSTSADDCSGCGHVFWSSSITGK